MSVTEKYIFGLVSGKLCLSSYFVRCAIANRVLKDYEGVIRQAENPSNVACRHLKGLSAKNHCTLAHLLECNAVMQTAR